MPPQGPCRMPRSKANQTRTEAPNLLRMAVSAASLRPSTPTWCRPLLRTQILTLLNRNELVTTEIDDALMAKAANIGLISMPKKGYSRPAATGTPEAL